MSRTEPLPPSRWSDPRLVLWALSVGNLVLAMTAPVRPWGWAGGPMLGFAAVTAVLAWRGTGRVPARRYWPVVLAGAGAYALALPLVAYGGIAAG